MTYMESPSIFNSTYFRTWDPQTRFLGAHHMCIAERKTLTKSAVTCSNELERREEFMEIR